MQRGPRLRVRSTPVKTPIVLGTETTYAFQNGVWVQSGQNVNTFNPPQGAFLTLEKTWDELHPGPPYLSGGPFMKYGVYNSRYDIQGVGTYRPHNARKYVGGFIPGGLVSNVYFPQSDLQNVGGSGTYSGEYGSGESFGAEAWKRYKPKTSIHDVALFIGEMKDVPSMFKKSAKGFSDLWRSMGGHPTRFGPKDVADHWLNTQFGWAPFISDMKKFGTTSESIGRRLFQISRDNGQWIKRGGTFRTLNEIQNRRIGFPGLSPNLHTDYFNLQNIGGTQRAYQSTLYDEVSEKVWFEGRFKYYIPVFSPERDGMYDHVMRLMHMYGFRISPSLVYNLTPWSWLADYFTNLGDVIDNISSTITDRLVAKYAYVMRHIQVRKVNDCTIFLKGGRQNCFWYQEVETKNRVTASPFGFGLSSSGLSLRQKSILAALGISRIF